MKVKACPHVHPSVNTRVCEDHRNVEIINFTCELREGRHVSCSVIQEKPFNKNVLLFVHSVACFFVLSTLTCLCSTL